MGHYLALGDRSGNPGSCCNVIFCRSLVAGTEVYESGPYLSAPNLGVSVANESLWITCTVLQKYQSTKTRMKSYRDPPQPGLQGLPSKDFGPKSE